MKRVSLRCFASPWAAAVGGSLLPRRWASSSSSDHSAASSVDVVSDGEQFVRFAAAQPRVFFTPHGFMTVADAVRARDEQGTFATVDDAEWRGFLRQAKREIVVQLASLCRLIDDAPYGFWAMPAMKHMRHEYLQSVLELRAIADHCDDEFVAGVRGVFHRHRTAAERLAEALRQFVTAKTPKARRGGGGHPTSDAWLVATAPNVHSKAPDAADKSADGTTANFIVEHLAAYDGLQRFCDRFVTHRAGVRLIIAHLLRLHHVVSKGGAASADEVEAAWSEVDYGVPRGNQRGSMGLAHPVDIVRRAELVTRAEATARWGEAHVPKVNMRLSGPADGTVTTFSSAFFHCTAALLGHALAAGAARSSTKGGPQDVNVLICLTSEGDATIRVTDPTGGVSPAHHPVALDYLYAAEAHKDEAANDHGAAAGQSATAPLPLEGKALGWARSSLRLPYAATVARGILGGDLRVAHVEGQYAAYYLYLPKSLAIASRKQRSLVQL